MSPQYYPSGLKKFLEQELRQKCDEVFGEGMAAVSVVADWGRPDSHLIELASDFHMDLIVLGASQRRGLGRLGSVSRAVVHYTHMNVVCVPIPTAAMAPASSPPSVDERPVNQKQELTARVAMSGLTAV